MEGREWSSRRNELGLCDVNANVCDAKIQRPGTIDPRPGAPIERLNTDEAASLGTGVGDGGGDGWWV